MLPAPPTVSAAEARELLRDEDVRIGLPEDSAPTVAGVAVEPLPCPAFVPPGLDKRRGVNSRAFIGPPPPGTPTRLEADDEKDNPDLIDLGDATGDCDKTNDDEDEDAVMKEDDAGKELGIALAFEEAFG